MKERSSTSVFIAQLSSAQLKVDGVGTLSLWFGKRGCGLRKAIDVGSTASPRAVEIGKPPYGSYTLQRTIIREPFNTSRDGAIASVAPRISHNINQWNQISFTLGHYADATKELHNEGKRK